MNACETIYVLTRLQERHPRYHRGAYVFLLDALHDVIARQEERRHISGQELVEEARGLAIARFGPLARTVLEYWGIHSTDDVGELVFALVDIGVLVKRDEDRREDFEDLFDFEQVFDHDYPWSVAT